MVRSSPDPNQTKREKMNEMKLSAKQVAKLVAAAPYVCVYSTAVNAFVKVMKTDIIERLKYLGEDLVSVSMSNDGALHF